MRAIGTYALAIAGLSVTLAVVVGVATTLVGLTDTARDALGLTFTRPPRTTDAALAIAATNARLIATAFAACFALRLNPSLRRPIDAILVALLALNATAIGSALGAYGAELVRALALHGTVELSAFSLAGGSYTYARRGSARARELLAAGIASFFLIGIAALVETWLSPGTPA